MIEILFLMVFGIDSFDESTTYGDDTDVKLKFYEKEKLLWREVSVESSEYYIDIEKMKEMNPDLEFKWEQGSDGKYLWTVYGHNYGKDFAYFLLLVTSLSLIGFGITMIFYNKIYTQQKNPNVVQNK